LELYFLTRQLKKVKEKKGSKGKAFAAVRRRKFTKNEREGGRGDKGLKIIIIETTDGEDIWMI